jgi:hypothetical protein
VITGQCTHRQAQSPLRAALKQLFGAEFSEFHVSKEDPVEPRCDQFDAQLFEAEYFADEDSVLVPTDLLAIVDSSQQETLWIPEFWQLAGQSDRKLHVKGIGPLPNTQIFAETFAELRAEKAPNRPLGSSLLH